MIFQPFQRYGWCPPKFKWFAWPNHVPLIQRWIQLNCQPRSSTCYRQPYYRIWSLCLHSLFGTRVQGDPIGISPRSLVSTNQSPWAIVWRCLRHPIFSRFGIQYRHVTDRRTERRADTRQQYRASVAACIPRGLTFFRSVKGRCHDNQF